LGDSRTLLELRNVHAGYGEIEVIKDVSLLVRRGEIVSVIGANGAGKSTLLKAIFGLIRSTSGSIHFDGHDITDRTELDRLRLGVSYVPEGRSNFPEMTVQENLEMGAYIRKKSDETADAIEQLCERFPILMEKRHTPVGNLSGGQQQILEIAMGMMLEPRLLMIDEPTLGLAPILATEVFEIIQEINAAGTTIVLVEQNAKRALEISDHGFVLELGAVRYQGAGDELKHNQEVLKAYLGRR
jgi:branched-chain amino acid transport system ATP-binding protein